MADANTHEHALDNIVYIQIPEELGEHIGDFEIDPNVLLPVETQQEPDQFRPNELSWEQIISGMLKILAHQPEHENADYYRRFIMAVKPDIVDELTETGIFKARNRELDIAEEIFGALWGLMPGDNRVQLNLALLFEQRADAYNEAGNQELSNSYTEKAFEMYKTLFSQEEVMPEAHFNGAFFYMKQHNYEKARSHFSHFVESSTDEEKTEEAKRIIKEIDSQNLLDNMFKEAYDYIQMGKEEEGIEKINTFLKHHPDVWNAWFLLGWGHRRLSRFDQARDAFLKALEHGPEHVDTLNELAICLMELGELDRSRARLEQAIRIEPENTKVLSNMGIVAMKQEELDEATGYFHAVLDIEPEDSIARHYLELLQQQD